jgi:CRP-like cAMP-binding protein
MPQRKFVQGSVLVREGELTNAIFILLSGRLGVFKGAIKISEFEEKGIVLGEMSVILHEKRTATIKALEDTLVIELKAGLDELINEYPEIAKKIMINLATRLKKTTQEYWLIATELNQQQMAHMEETHK